MGVRRFEDLVAWQLAWDLREKVFAFTDKPRAARDVKFCGQIREATRSAAANTAEGFGRFYPREFARFLRIAAGSLHGRDHGHGDIRTENVWIDRDGNGRLLQPPLSRDPHLPVGFWLSARVDTVSAKALAGTAPGAVEGSTLTLALAESNPLFAERIQAEAAAVEEVVRRHTGQMLRIRVTVAGGKEAAAGPRPRAITESSLRADRLRAFREQDPALDTAADALDLEIVD